jgi:diguanylate cyclase (GGDEF)-like protein/PAS domain S-box-containing protein
LETKILRLLFVDDSPDEAELALTVLRKGGYLLKPQRVNDLAGLHAAIEKGGWDAVIAERTLPHFGVNVVLDTLKQAKLDAPVIILTRAVPDAEIATLMRAGARDVILKNQMARLLPALERELVVAAERAEHRAAVQALKEIQDKHRAVVDGAREAICYSHDGMHIDANKAYLDMFEYANMAELEGVPVMNLIDKNEHGRFKQSIRKAGEPSGPQEFLAIRKSGARFPVEIAVSSITLNREACTQILFTDVSKRKAVETKLQYLNQHDPLTGLYNRHHFLQELSQAIERTKRDDAVHGVIYVDFPDLRQVTKALGQAAADRFLLAAARLLRETFGASALVARYGDHEFAALVLDVQPIGLQEVATRAKQAFAESPVSEHGMPIKCDCRVAALPIDRQTESAQRAMTSVYPAAEPAAKVAPGLPASSAGAKPFVPVAPIPAKVKPAGPAPTAVHTKPVAVPAGTRPATHEWQDQIKAALERDAFRLIYQPIVNLHGDAAEYFEVLVRLVDQNDKLIPASHFMPRAEETGQSVAIDRWVVLHSIRALAELHRQLRKVTFFVNLSPSALRDVELVVIAQQALHETRLSGEYIIFEIDEAAVATNPESAMAFMRAAKKIGCSFCIDNFGRALAVTGRLREPLIEYVKLDAGLVRDLSSDPVAQASLKAVIEVAKAMEKKTIAKSVESAEALSVLWNVGVDYVQGHYFQEADAALNYEFAGETTLSSEGPQWAVANGTKNH